MNSERISGVLLHVTSLPSLGGVGDFGPAAYGFVDFLASAKQRLWQVLPLSPTGYGSSPYSALSALNPHAACTGTNQTFATLFAANSDRIFRPASISSLSPTSRGT